MSRYAEFFLNTSSKVVQLELLEISHPAFSRTYRIVRNAVAGATVTLTDGEGEATFEYYPLRITPLSSQDDLDQAIRVDLGDLGETLPAELDAVFAADALDTVPTVRYWAYRSDDLTAPLVGPLTFEVRSLSFNQDGASFEAGAPSLNRNRTGELYLLTRFPMLRGFL